jgi:predicted aldo/keto reductase-like oxidoreductase
MKKDLETSLTMMKTDYIDVYQFHNPAFCPRPGDGTGLYEAAMEAKEQGIIRHIGITNHRLPVAKEAIESGLYETMQFPFSYLADEKDLELVGMCKEADMGFVCMKSLSGGLITRADAAYAYLAQYDVALPIWGIQHESELDEFLAFQSNPPQMTDEISKFIESERTELTGAFCRSCGYCLPCPMDIVIPQCNRMSLLLRRMPPEGWLTEQWQAEMDKIDTCIECRACVSRCPYELDIPNTLKKNLEDYREFLHTRT